MRDDKKNIEFQILTALFDFGFLALVIGDLGSQRLEDDPSNMITRMAFKCEAVVPRGAVDNYCGELKAS